MSDLISRQAAINAVKHAWAKGLEPTQYIEDLPPAQPTLYGYNIEQLERIAKILQKENLPPERVTEALTGIGRIVAIVKDEFEEALRKAAEECTI